MNQTITVKELKLELKNLGVSGYSNKNKESLIDMYNQAILKGIKKNKKLSYSKRVRKIPSSFKSRRKGNAMEKFNILFDDITVNDFKIQTGNEGVLFSKNYNNKNPKAKKNFFKYLEVLSCGGFEDYMWSSVEMAHKKNKKYSGDEKLKEDNTVDYVYTVDSDNVPCAILLAHRGECEEMRSWWTVRLICNHPDPECKGGANKLLGLYSFALKSKKIQTHGLLEIAENYNNIGGYCLYSRYGFVESNIKCDVFEWMVMANELRKISFDQIIDTVKTGKKQIKDTGSTLYCEELKNSSKKGVIPKKRTESEFYIKPVISSITEPEPDEDINIDLLDGFKQNETFYASDSKDEGGCLIM